MKKDHPHYSSINLKNLDISSQYVLENDSKELKNMNQVSMFVGANNCGKSRLLRSLFSADFYQYKSSIVDIDLVRKTATIIDNEIKQHLNQPHMHAGILNQNTMSDWIDLEFFDKKELSFDKYKKLVDTIAKNKFMGSYTVGLNPDHITSFVANVALMQQILINKLDDSLGDEPRVYIPILRGLRPVNGDIDVYLERTKKDYNFSFDTENKKIFTGLGLYEEINRLQRGSRDDRITLKNYNNFLQEEFFEGQTIEITSRHDADTVYISIGGAEDMPIYLLGDGIQSIIILSFLAFTAKQRTMFFIEEPDLYLHPGMQRKFLELILKHELFSKHQFIFTTHSNHFLDMTVDYPAISVFLFKKEKEQFYIRNVNCDDKRVLHEIGVRNSSVFLTNVTIWVEGITDRLYIREWLRKYIKENRLSDIKEDSHFSIIEYGGSSLVHFKFDEISENLEEKINVSKICGTSFVVMDGDATQKAERYEKMKAQLGDNIYALRCKEIENLISPDILIAATKNLISRSKLKDTVDSTLFEKIDIKEYGASDVALGTYLDKILNIQYFAASSGTIKQKTALCDEVIKLMNDESTEWNLTEETKVLCNKIYNLICKHND